jgi:hypothetical protein
MKISRRQARFVIMRVKTTPDMGLLGVLGGLVNNHNSLIQNKQINYFTNSLPGYYTRRSTIAHSKPIEKD